MENFNYIIEELLKNSEYNNHPLIEGRLMQKFDLVKNWEKSELILLPGEIAVGFYLNDTNNEIDDKIEIVIGTGSKTYRNLPKIKSDLSHLNLDSIIVGKHNQIEGNSSGYGIIGDNNTILDNSNQSFMTGYLNSISGKYSSAQGIKNSIIGNYAIAQGAFNLVHGEGNQSFGLGNSTNRIITYGNPCLFLSKSEIPFKELNSGAINNGEYFRSGGKIYQRELKYILDTGTIKESLFNYIQANISSYVELTEDDVNDFKTNVTYDGSSHDKTYCKKTDETQTLYFKLKEGLTAKESWKDEEWEEINFEDIPPKKAYYNFQLISEEQDFNIGRFFNFNSTSQNQSDEDLIYLLHFNSKEEKPYENVENNKMTRYQIFNSFYTSKDEEGNIKLNLNTSAMGYNFGENIFTQMENKILNFNQNNPPKIFQEEITETQQCIIYNLHIPLLTGFNNKYYFCFYPKHNTGSNTYLYSNVNTIQQNDIEILPYEETKNNLNSIKKYPLIVNATSNQFASGKFSYNFGNYNINGYNNCFLMGEGLLSKQDNQIILGSYNYPWNNGTFIIGNGTDNNNRSTAFGIRKTDGAIIFPKNNINTQGGSIRVNSDSNMVLSATGSRILVRFNSIDGQASNGYVFRENRFTPEQSNTIDLAQPGIRFKTGYLHTADINSALVDTEYIKEKTDKTGTEPHQIREGILFSKKVTQINEETKKETASYPHFGDIYLDHGTNSLILGSINNIAIRPHGTIYNGQKITTNESNGISTITNDGIVFSEKNIYPEKPESYSLGINTNRFDTFYGRSLNLKGKDETHDFGSGTLPNAITLSSSDGETEITGIGLANNSDYTLFGSTSYFYFKPKGNDKFGNGSTYGVKITEEGIIPQTNNKISLGNSSYGFTNLYLGDKIKFSALKGNSANYNKLEISAGDNLILQSGANNSNAIFMKLGSSSKLLKFSWNGSQIQIAPNNSTDSLALGTADNKVSSINGVAFPTSGTYTLKCINGNLQWVAD